MEKYIPTYPSQQNNTSEKKKILRATRWMDMEQRLDQKQTFQQ